MRETTFFCAVYFLSNYFAHRKMYSSRNGRKDRNLTVSKCVRVRSYMCEHTREMSRFNLSLINISLLVCRGIAVYILVDSERILRSWISVCFFLFIFIIKSSTVLFLRSDGRVIRCVDITATWIYWKCSTSRRKSKPLSSRNSNIGIVECFMLRYSAKVLW